MTQAHTPGPWQWRRMDGPQWRLAPGVLLVDFGMTDGTPDGDAIDRANARLIAAAPDLLEALDTSREGWENALELGLIPETHRDTAQNLLARCRAAIAKAKGGAE